jgi:hypothetical protein
MAGKVEVLSLDDAKLLEEAEPLDPAGAIIWTRRSYRPGTTARCRSP